MPEVNAISRVLLDTYSFKRLGSHAVVVPTQSVLK